MALLSLEKSIIATLVYYDVLNRPLTGWEVFKYLVRLRSIQEIRSNPYLEGQTFTEGLTLSRDPRNQTSNLDFVLEILEKSELVEQKNGFYFLKGRSKIVKQRIERQKIADQKWKKARRAIRFLQALPYIRLVAVSGSLAMNNTKEESDIDLLIITKAGRIWTCRALATLYFHLIGQRRHGNLTKNRFCLNHYITDSSLEIPWPSLYNAQTYAHLVPLWQKKGLYHKFQKANKWIGQYLVNYSINQKGYLTRLESNQFLGLIRKFREWILDNWFGDLLEFFLKKVQEKKIKKEPLTFKSGGRVSFDDQQLEFHPDSPEKNILERYNQKMKELGLAELGNEKDSGLI